MSTVEQRLDDRYARLFGRVAGYLPRDRAAVDSFHEDVAARAASRTEIMSPSVRALAKLIERDGVIRMYATEMIDQVDTAHRNIKSIGGMLSALDEIVGTAPAYDRDPSKQNSFPVSTLFTYVMMTPAGEAIFRIPDFNDALRAILSEWCAFLDGPASRSVLNEGAHGWLSQPAFEQNKLYEFVIPDRAAPHWGFASYNSYFHREIKAEFRPIAAPDDAKVIVSPNDGSVVTWQENVKECDEFWLKGQPFSLRNMLAGLYVDRFVGGTVFQSFLSGADYHRWRAPVAGRVVQVEKVNGLMFSDLEAAGPDPTAATFSQGYEASVNTRGLAFIESPDPKIGMVCVIPIGITEISSISFCVKPGDHVSKGAELGYFSYGGSSMAIAFQPGAVKRFTVPANTSTAPSRQDDGPPIFVNAQLAEAN